MISPVLAALALAWVTATPLPQPRTEVGTAVLGDQIVVVGGLTGDGAASARADAYSTASGRWRRLPDLPAAVHHPLVASGGERVYVAGGYGGALGAGRRLRSVFAFDGIRWRSLPRMPEPRAAGGAAVVRGRLYVVGGVGAAGLARRAFALDLGTRRWSVAPSPTPRQHLAVTAAGGRIYALGGRRAGYDTNVATFESWAPGEERWRRLPDVPGARGGTGAAVAAGSLVSVGGEEPAGTIASVYAWHLTRGGWRRLPDLPAPRHGLGVAAVGTRVYAVAGGPEPGLTVSGANQYLDLR
ncbi:MAG: Kelch repeat-containing protein [Verrucomicrobiota bacterium]